MRAAVVAQFSAGDQRAPHGGFFRKLKSLRHYADLHGASGDVRIGAVTSAPKSIAENRDTVVAARAIVFVNNNRPIRGCVCRMWRRNRQKPSPLPRVAVRLRR